MIGIFGGSFDPPHTGHLEIIQKFWGKFPKAKSLLIIPNHISPLKDRKSANKADILEMLQILISSFDPQKTIIRKDEIEKGNISYTIDTLTSLKKEFADEELFLLIGEDHLRSFHLWKDYTEILTMVRLCVYKRKLQKKLNSAKNHTPTEKIIYMDNQIIPVSSSEIREDLRNGTRNKYLPSGICNYITGKGLYSS